MRLRARALYVVCLLVTMSACSVTPTLFRQYEYEEEVYLSLDSVKGHLRALFEKFGIGDLPQNQKRVRLVELALRQGVISVRDLDRSG